MADELAFQHPEAALPVSAVPTIAYAAHEGHGAMRGKQLLVAALQYTDSHDRIDANIPLWTGK